MRILCVIVFFILCFYLQPAAAQTNYNRTSHSRDTILVSAIINGNDTIPYVALPELLVTDRVPARFRRRIAQWNRLRNAVYVTYPYAVAASRILKDVDTHLATLHTEHERKLYLAGKEKELQAEFGDKLENLSIYQGKILMKLISRQTGSNCYNIIRQLKGGFSARFWQTIAFVFGSNLKSDYDQQEDQDIEVIVREIEAGQGRYSYNYN